MKIISGKHKGKVIKGYDIVGTRPTMDRVKESLFAMIQDYVRESFVLDLFSGTGNLGIEALSNGASFCYFNDLNKKCTTLISKVLEEINEKDSSKVLNMDYKKALECFKENSVKFDLIFLDPPYKKNILNDVVKYIYDNGLLNENGLIVCEVDDLYLDIDYLEKIKEKKYGNKYIIIYKNIFDKL